MIIGISFFWAIHLNNIVIGTVIGFAVLIMKHLLFIGQLLLQRYTVSFDIASFSFGYTNI